MNRTTGILLGLVSMTAIFQATLFLTGRISLDEARVAVKLEKSDETIVAELRDETSQSSDLVLQWKSLVDQRNALRAEKRDLMALEARISIDSETVAQEREAIGRLMAALDDSVSQKRTREIKKLVKLYDSMRPGDAARVFKGLDPQLAADILTRVKARQSARILAALDPSRAAELSQRMTGQYVETAASSTGERAEMNR